MSGGPGWATAEKAAVAVARYGMLSGGETVVVGVSGGPDSMALLDILRRMQAGLDLVVAHVDHQLSERSEEIAAEVAGFASKEGIEVHVARAQGLEGPNLHARARDFRYSFFEAIAGDVGAAAIATGHTLDDRVETTVARLIHGAGTDALVGIPASEGNRIRPLITHRRAETKAYCDELGINYYEDPSNDDPRFDRSMVRNEIVSRIEDHWGEGAVLAMASSVDRLAEDSAALKTASATLYTQIASTVEGGVDLNLEQLGGLPRAYRRRLLELAVGRVRDRGAAIEAVLDALERADRKPDARFRVADGPEIVITKDAVTVRVEP